MEEELVKILSNTELDDTKKAEEIQKTVNALYVPATTVAEERKANKEALANKDKAFADLTAEYDTYKQSKMTEEEQNVAMEKVADCIRITNQKYVGYKSFEKNKRVKNEGENIGLVTAELSEEEKRMQTE